MNRESLMRGSVWSIAIIATCIGAAASITLAGEVQVERGTFVDLSKARWFAGPGLEVGPGSLAGPMLADGVFERTGIRMERATALDADAAPIIAILSNATNPAGASGAAMRRLLERANAGFNRAEGFEIYVDTKGRVGGGGPTVFLIGNDVRGVLFAVGGLLRHCQWSDGVLRVPTNLHLESAPAITIRGHQLGYRDAANSYDAWDVPQFERYVRDLMAFGCNAIELIPPLERSAPKGRHMPKSPWDMTVALSSMLNKYGLDVWLWAPIEQTDVSKPELAAAFLAKRDELFRECPRIDAIFVPGGDPGDTPPAVLFPFLQQLAQVLRRSHPKAQIWVSPQMLQTSDLETFFGYLEKNQPPWLTGVVYGPWIWASLEETRKRMPARYPIRNYPDITHTVRCQFAVPNFDQAFAFTLGREPINPRPVAYANIHALQSPLTCGTITYSDGVNDDVNKFVWSGLDWQPGRDPKEILREYGRYFFGANLEDEIADGLIALEDNLVGKARTSKSIPKSLALWKKLEAKATTNLKGNWRFQQPLFRAYFDALVAARACDEAELESRAIRSLGAGADPLRPRTARAILSEADAHRSAPEYRKRVLELADDLYRSIGMQLDTTTYGASGSERGAVLDYLDETLNDRRWLEARLSEIEKTANPDAARKLVDAMVRYEDPGPGGFYDDLGDPDRQPHLLPGAAWADDPGFLRSPQCEHNLWNGARLSWLTQAQTIYHTPLRMRYDGLDPAAEYRVRIVYFGRFRSTMSLTANGTLIHGPLPQSESLVDGLPRPAEFAIPRSLTARRTLELTWTRHAGRGCQVAEVFLLKR